MSTAGSPLDRRAFISTAIGAVAGYACAPVHARARNARSALWTLDNLVSVGGHSVTTIGDPALTDSPWGPAIRFDGEDDGLLIDTHPLAGAKAFTIESLFRPVGGAFEQRWLHLESHEQPPVPPGTGSTRTLFEIRVVEDRWYLDAFTAGLGYKQAMMAPERTFPVGRWYKVEQSFDGRTYRSFVDGELQMERPIDFKPQGPGRTALGMRMNRVSFFRGAVRHVRFTARG